MMNTISFHHELKFTLMSCFSQGDSASYNTLKKSEAIVKIRAINFYIIYLQINLSLKAKWNNGVNNLQVFTSTTPDDDKETRFCDDIITMASVKPYFKVTKLSKCTQKHTYKQSNA
jgi:hypothetical protein